MKKILFLTFVSIILVSCSKEKIETSTVTDHEGNHYKTIKIGDQWWMAENMRAVTLSNGDTILKNPSNNVFSYDQPYCYYYEDEDENLVSEFKGLGCYYNWEAAKQICPYGWHLPTVEEYKELYFEVVENFKYPAQALASQRYWQKGDQKGAPGKGVQKPSDFMGLWGTLWNRLNGSVNRHNNDSQFDAIPAGYWQSYSEAAGCSISADIQRYAYFWTSSEDEYNSDQVECPYLYYDSPDMNYKMMKKCEGLNVRCVKE